jgi:hypothetical protein
LALDLGSCSIYYIIGFPRQPERLEELQQHSQLHQISMDDSWYQFVVDIVDLLNDESQDPSASQLLSFVMDQSVKAPRILVRQMELERDGVKRKYPVVTLNFRYAINEGRQELAQITREHADHLGRIFEKSFETDYFEPVYLN